MLEHSAEQLSSLAPSELADALVRMAQEARAAVREGDLLSSLEHLELVLQAAERSREPQLGLLEVAAAFLKVIGRADYGSQERAVREFLGKHGEAGVDALEQLAARSAAKTFLDKLSDEIGQHLRELQSAGILREDGGRVDVAPAWRSLVQDLLEPRSFRIWREVEQVRKRVDLENLDESQATNLLASQFGVDATQARRYVLRTGLSPRGRSVTGEALYRRPLKYGKVPLLARADWTTRMAWFDPYLANKGIEPGEITPGNTPLVIDAATGNTRESK